MKRLSWLASIFFLIIVALVAIGFVISARKNYQNLPDVQKPKSTETVLVPVSQAVATVSAKPSTQNGNFLLDPGFEDRSPAWVSHINWQTQFKFDDKLAKSGKLSALLELDSRLEGSQSTRVHGVYQDLTPSSFPKFISGNYYVENWQKTTKKQYLQVVVIIFDPDNIPPDIDGGRNYQIRYILAGSKVAPLDIKNAKYIIVNPDEPVIGKWVHFERNFEEDIKQQWGAVPKKFSSIRVLFEARWDERTETVPVIGKVRYDDVFLGTKP